MARKKALTRKADAEVSDEAKEQLGQQMHRRSEFARLLQSRPRCDITTLDVSTLLLAAEQFLQEHAAYREFVAGPGRDSIRMPDLLFRALHTAQRLLRAFEDAGVTGPRVDGEDPAHDEEACAEGGSLPAWKEYINDRALVGPAAKREALEILLQGVWRLLDELENSPLARKCLIGVVPGKKAVSQPFFCVQPGEVFHFPPVAVAEIELGVKQLRLCPDEEANGNRKTETAVAESNKNQNEDNAAATYPFGVELNEDNLTASRGDVTVDFTSKPAWKLFKALLRKGDSFFNRNELWSAAWKNRPEDNTFEHQLSVMKKTILPLGLDKETKRDVGVKLIDLLAQQVLESRQKDGSRSGRKGRSGIGKKRPRR
jgi:hypothetical protein